MTRENKTNLQRWVDTQNVFECLWASAWGDQIAFARDVLTPLIGMGLDYEARQAIPNVISTHRSKSVTLPIYEFTRQDLGLTLVARNNFYNWKLSVISARPINADFTGLFHTSPPVDPEYTGDPLAPVYFEGFPPALIFSYYDTSAKKAWSAEIASDYALCTTVFLILRALDAIPAYIWAFRKGEL